MSFLVMLLTVEQGLVYKKGKFSAIEEQQLKTAIENFKIVSRRGKRSIPIHAALFSVSLVPLVTIKYLKSSSKRMKKERIIRSGLRSVSNTLEHWRSV